MKNLYRVFSFPYRRGKEPLAEFSALATAKAYVSTHDPRKVKWLKEEALYEGDPAPRTTYYSDNYYIEVVPSGSHATKRTSVQTTAIDTTETLDRKFQPRRRDALTLSEKARQARGAAARWTKRSTAHARAGEFREADDAEAEAVALGRMAADLEAEASSLRAARR